MKRPHVCIALASCLIICANGLAAAAILSPGDIVVAALGELQVDGDGAIYKVNPVTGDRTIISGAEVGSGPGFDPTSVAVTTIHDIYVAEHTSDAASIHHVDVLTGNRQIIASSTVGSGPVLQSAFDIIVRDDGKLVISDAWGGTLVLVDPVTLERSVVSGPGVGTGPALSTPVGMTLDTNGDILITTAAPFDQPSSLMRVDALTGDREIISSSDTGSGPVPDFWSDVVVSTSGQALVANHGVSPQTTAVLSVDLASGDRAITSAIGTGAGPQLLQPFGMGIEADGSILVANVASVDSLIRINPTTGDRTIVSGIGVGSGPEFLSPRYLDIVTVPEPSSIVLIASGFLLIVLTIRRRRCATRHSEAELR